VQRSGQGWSLVARGTTLYVDLAPELELADLEPLISAVGDITRLDAAVRHVVFRLPKDPMPKVVDAFMEALAQTIRSSGLSVAFDHGDPPKIVVPEDI
jgi:hypothetical protein